MTENRAALVPENLRRNIVGLHRERGAQWLDSLPALIAEIAAKWRLAIEPPFAGSSYNFVAPCVCIADNRPAVLKIGFAEQDSIILSEARFLAALDGDGAARLLRADERRCALLLERLLPGDELKTLCRIDDAAATRCAIEVLRRIRREPPPEHRFPTLETWTRDFRQADQTVLGNDFVGKAQDCFAELIGQSQQFLLHGDFHHQNVLSAEREPFLAIDPKGIVGDVGYEIAVFLNNPRGWLLSQPDCRQIAERRVRQFAENFEIELADLRKWAFAVATLAAWWAIEDGGDGDAKKWLACAAIWNY